jgi:hypothetical protein
MNVHRITRLVAVVLAGAALAAPAASARPMASDSPVPPGGKPVVIEPAPAPVVQRFDDGFDWGSAAIGAGAVGAVVFLIGVGGTRYRHRHDDIGMAR